VWLTVAPALTQTVPKVLSLVIVQLAVIWWQQVHPVQLLHCAIFASVEHALFPQLPLSVHPHEVQLLTPTPSQVFAEQSLTIVLQPQPAQSPAGISEHPRVSHLPGGP